MKSAVACLVIFQILSCCIARPQSPSSIYDSGRTSFEGSFGFGPQVQTVQQPATYSSGWYGYQPSAYSLGTMVDGLLGAATNIFGGLSGLFYPPTPPSPYQWRGARARAR